MAEEDALLAFQHECDVYANYPILDDGDDATMAVVRLPDPKLKTLGERGIECIFVGYAEHSKAFRLSYPRPRLIFPKVTEDIDGSVVPEVSLIEYHKTADCYGINSQSDYSSDGCEDNFFEWFSMKDTREADVILGIRTKHESNGIVIFQSHYIEKVLKKFNYFDCTPVSTLMDTSEKLMPNNVDKLSRYTSNPGTQHWQAIQRVLKYLKKTMDYRLTYTGYPSASSSLDV
ncbi:hypothetical protein Tco_0804414 [Tanacetum coccineum]|uniref:Retroviral polymerase SH3-like domain-containing protein n=1 Tax=Tanacetum coccineum TaxID=301880 RepID=A0ABQ5A783_9ASTR